MKKYGFFILVVAFLIVAGTFISSKTGTAPSPPKEVNTETNNSDSGSGGEVGNTQPTGTVIPKESGRVVFAITDAAADMGKIKAIFLTTTKIQVHSEAKGWITVSSVPKTFDLLELKKTGSFGLLADVSLEKGSYSQMRLTVSEVKVEHNDSTTQIAKLPSGDVRLVGITTVTKGETSAVTFDFEADRSLHTTTDGKYIFAPVVKILTRTNVIVEILVKNKVRFSSGVTSIEYNIGMDENGVMKNNFALDPLARFEVVNNIITIKPQGTSDVGAQISAAQAIDIAKKNGLTTVLSVRLETKDTGRVWNVTGLKGTALLVIKVHAETGAVLQ